MSHEGKKKHFILPQGKGVGERNGYCKSTNKQLSLSMLPIPLFLYCVRSLYLRFYTCLRSPYLLFARVVTFLGPLAN